MERGGSSSFNHGSLTLKYKLDNQFELIFAICFWLVENGFAVLIVACDTFQAGAVEQLHTHTRHLNALHPAEKHGGRSLVQLYEKGYGKDAAGIAMEAIKYAHQDQPARSRSVCGRGLGCNEVVDQLTKFSLAADDSDMNQPQPIDGIVITKFDTINNKVGAAISMTYTTGQPTVFVGTGQT
ncbi:signal recognition particle receptor subunit alpha-like [Acanthaster planci]|uniref:Signal recognition particle receptor subunit alpha-like n=1 Tax=Acanthaster planci TaxID=133434 RepID=A0A8B7ZVV6_ACAPL|nr:signal recognition particle receptor subunit alpha-like [Acanthaster planci]